MSFTIIIFSSVIYASTKAGVFVSAQINWSEAYEICTWPLTFHEAYYMHRPLTSMNFMEFMEDILASMKEQIQW